MPARYPTAVATPQDLKIAANQRQSSLALPMSATDMVAFVKDGTQFGSNMLLSIDNEIVSAASVSGNQITLDARAFDGTTAAAHAANSKVSVLIDAWHHNAAALEIEAIEATLGPNLSNVSAGGISAATYNFAAQSPGGALIVGANTITMSPVPAGVNGTDVGHKLYVAGTGTPEAATVIGGSGVAGSPSGQIIIQCANPHPAGWTIQSASGGLQEAICSLPTAGGTVQVMQAITLFADVGPCGKTDVEVNKLAGAVVTGAFLVLGSTISGILGPVNTGNHNQTFNQTVVLKGPYADLRAFGAVTDGTTNNWAALQAADAAGARVVFVPASCKIQTDTLVGLTHVQRIIGEDWNTSVITTSNPTTVGLQVPRGMMLEFLTLATLGCTGPGHSGPIGMYLNSRVTTDSPSFTPYNAFVNSVSDADVPQLDGQFDLQGMGIRQYGSGDGLYTEVMTGATGLGINAFNTGNGVGVAVKQNSALGVGLQVMDTPLGKDGAMGQFFSNHKTSGVMLNFTQNTSTYGGVMITAAMAQGSGSFTGYFLQFQNNTTTAVLIDGVGNTTLAAGAALILGTAKIRSGGGAPNGAVPGNVGDLWINTAGGAGTTLWVKESGAGTNTGWVGK